MPLSTKPLLPPKGLLQCFPKTHFFGTP
ncbi:hypothetical protein CFP56_042215 [Quercus suber]|uniref:Uncharacterized protein n=1 Tax=Quercus suber TaxID=58331 RepID=A0AAW0MBR4_QUESU